MSPAKKTPPAPDAATKKMVREVSLAVSRNVAQKCVDETLLRLGVDVSDPIHAQTTMAGMRKIAEHADDLADMAKHFKGEETKDAIKFAKRVHQLYESTKARVIVALAALLYGSWITGVTDWIHDKMGSGS